MLPRLACTSGFIVAARLQNLLRASLTCGQIMNAQREHLQHSSSSSSCSSSSSAASSASSSSSSFAKVNKVSYIDDDAQVVTGVFCNTAIQSAQVDKDVATIRQVHTKMQQAGAGFSLLPTA